MNFIEFVFNDARPRTTKKPLSPKFDKWWDNFSGHQQQEQQPQNNQFNNNQGQNVNQGSILPFNGQAYGVPSNQGRYSGPSSYEVRLGSRTRNF